MMQTNTNKLKPNKSKIKPERKQEGLQPVPVKAFNGVLEQLVRTEPPKKEK
jgi:hypothetical protein